MTPKSPGFVLLEAMIAMVILFCGVVAVTESFRMSLRASEEGREMYRAALLLEGRILEMEKIGHRTAEPESDPVLGPMIWKEDLLDNESPDWREHRLSLAWQEGKKSHELNLST